MDARLVSEWVWVLDGFEGAVMLGQLSGSLGVLSGGLGTLLGSERTVEW